MSSDTKDKLIVRRTYMLLAQAAYGAKTKVLTETLFCPAPGGVRYTIRSHSGGQGFAVARSNATESVEFMSKRRALRVLL